MFGLMFVQIYPSEKNWLTRYRRNVSSKKTECVNKY